MEAIHRKRIQDNDESVEKKRQELREVEDTRIFPQPKVFVHFEMERQEGKRLTINFGITEGCSSFRRRSNRRCGRINCANKIIAK
jgi:hypothetical protein